MALAAADKLAAVGIEAEVIDAATLLPFDRPGIVGASLRETNRLLVVDEDVPAAPAPTCSSRCSKASTATPGSTAPRAP